MTEIAVRYERLARYATFQEEEGGSGVRQAGAKQVESATADQSGTQRTGGWERSKKSPQGQGSPKG